MQPWRPMTRRPPFAIRESSQQSSQQRRAKRQDEETETMSFITGKHTPRRTFIRGVGATVALPFLDAMVPAGRVFARARATEPTRLICIEEVHGLAGCNNWAASKFLYAPEQVGPDFTLVPDNPLSTLDAHRAHMTIV